MPQQLGTTSSPTFAGLSLLSGGGTAGLNLRDTDAGGTDKWEFKAHNFFDQSGSGGDNHTLGLTYNRSRANALHPQWSENWEPHYIPGALPAGLLEKNWDYTSIDTSVSYRPFNFNIDLNTHAATMFWRVGVFSIDSRTGSDYVFYVDTATQCTSVDRLRVGGMGNGSSVFHVSGALGAEGALATIQATDAVAADVLLNLTANSVTGELNIINHESSATGTVNFLSRNTGTGGARWFAWAGSSGDAWFRTLANQDWSFGVDRTTGNWTVSNADVLGTNDRLSLSINGLMTLGGSSGLLQMSEITAPAAPAANGVRIYAEDDGAGKTRLMAVFSSGAAQQIAIQP